ncbi:MAG: NAD(P)-dependent oxidoreductase [Clostridia bacterium]|nr:NAD(P)-dependent oxidoreductase [Clostridia bacterium]
MKVLLVGGTGHIGTHLVPMLMAQGHDVYIATRGMTMVDTSACNGVQFISCDATSPQSLETIANTYSFDAVVDFPGTGYAVWQAFQGKAAHIIVCGSLWMFGRPHRVPTPELTQDSCPFDVYAERYAQIQNMLSQSVDGQTAFTAIMPSNICGPGKIPLDTMGGRSLAVHQANARGETVYLPDGPEALISPCDANDLAQLFSLTVNNRDAAAGQIFNGGAAYGLTASAFVRTYASIYGVEIPIAYVPWEKYKQINSEKSAWWHFYADMCPDISKAKTLLGYAPQYTPEQTMERAVAWMRAQGWI